MGCRIAQLVGAACDQAANSSSVKAISVALPALISLSRASSFATSATLKRPPARSAQARPIAFLPRATAITPNRREAAALLGLPDEQAMPVPDMARALQALGPPCVVITGGDAADTLAADWLQTPHAQGWLTLPRVATPHHHGTGCTHASGLAAALALGWVAADAAVLAKMLTTHALRGAHALGRGAGPVRASAGFGNDPSLMPRLSLDERLPDAWPLRDPGTMRAPGLYAIVDSAARVAACARRRR